MPDYLQETLDLLPKRTSFTTEDLKSKFPNVTRNAINGRLESLRSEGILIRHREGKWWIYERTTTDIASEKPKRKKKP